MLLKSVGKELHEDIVASRMMSAAAIVYTKWCASTNQVVVMSGSNSSTFCLTLKRPPIARQR